MYIKLVKIKTIPLLFSFLAVASIASIGVLGNTQTAFAGGGCSIDPLSVEVTLTPGGSTEIQKTFDCDSTIDEVIFNAIDCGASGITIFGLAADMVTETKWIVPEKISDNGAGLGITECTIPLTVKFVSAADFEVDQELKVTITTQVAGELLPLDSTALLLAGIQSMTVWMIPTVLGLAGAGVYLVKFRARD